MANGQAGAPEMQYTAEPAEGAKPSKNLIRDFFGIIFNPTQTFKNVLAAQYWVPMFLAILIISGGLEQVYHTQMMDTSIAKMQEKAGDNPQAVQGVADFYNSALSRPVFFISVAFGQVVALLITTVLYFFIASVISGGTAKFKGVWIVANWSFVIILLSMIIKTPLILATNNVETGLNLGLLAPIDAVGNKLHSALAVVDIFGIWHFIVAGLGLAVLYKFTTKKAITITFVVWLLMVIIGGGIAYISA